MKRIPPFAALVVILLLAHPAGAQDFLDPTGATLPSDAVTVSGSFEPAEVPAGGRAVLKVALTVAEGWHIYGAKETTGIPVELTIVDAGGLLAVGEPVVPDGEPHEVFGLTTHQIAGEATITQAFRVARDAKPGTVEVRGRVAFQPCTDDACYSADPVEFRATLTIVEGEAVPAEDVASAASPPDDGGAIEGGGGDRGAGLVGFLLFAVGAGLLALVMPCTYPMIPITISFFTKQGEARGGSVLPLSLAYGTGIIGIFVLIGIVIGPAIITFATHPVTNLVIAIVFMLFALVLFGVWNLQPPRFLMNAAGKASAQGGYLGVFLMGATLVVTSFTCTVPFVGSLLSLGATGGGLARVALGMGVFGATMAVPFVLLSLVPGALQNLPRSGEWMHTIKVTLGFVEVAAAFKFLSNADLAWQWQALPRELFLLLWAGIFALAALFLLGLIRMKGDSSEGVGPTRMVVGLLFLLFALYCFYGAEGHRLDRVMVAIAPNYSGREVSVTTGLPEGNGNGGTESDGASVGRSLVVDDYEAARARAERDGVPLFLNFTGFT